MVICQKIVNNRRSPPTMSKMITAILLAILGLSMAAEEVADSSAVNSQPRPSYSDPITSYVQPGGYNSVPTVYGGYSNGGYAPGTYDNNEESYAHGNGYDGMEDSTAVSGFKASSTALKVVAKIGIFLVVLLAMFLIGGAFMTGICSLTPLCTITFLHNYRINKETVRSLMTPDNLNAASTFVHTAIDKYQKLQRAINGNGRN